MITLTRDQTRLLHDTARGTGLVYTTGTADWWTTSRRLAVAGQGEWRAPAKRCDRDVATLIHNGLIAPRRTPGDYTPTVAAKRLLWPPSLTEMAQRALVAIRARAGLPDTVSVALSPILDAVDDLPALTAILDGSLIPCHTCGADPMDPTSFARHHLDRHATTTRRTA